MTESIAYFELLHYSGQQLTLARYFEYIFVIIFPYKHYYLLLQGYQAVINKGQMITTMKK